MRRKSGFTLIEVMIAIAVLIAITMIAGSVVVDAMRVASREQSLLQMDQDANRILEGVKHTLRPAYIPIDTKPLDVGREGPLAATDLASNVERWRDVLANGTDMLVFLVGIDPEGDGDIMYGSSQEDKQLILGIETPENSSAFPDGIREATDEHNTLSNLGIIDLNPRTDLGLPVDNSADIDITAARFAEPFVFPAPGGGRSPVYGVIRFAPAWQNNAIVTLDEARLNQDLNNDGDTTDRFALGHMEIVYPNSEGGVFTQSLSSQSVLLQINRNDTPQDSIFQLWPIGTDGNNLKVHVLLCDFMSQQNPWAFGRGGYQLITRTYEMRLKMQLMTVE